MRCAIVSDYGDEGGAAIAANRLCTALQNQSVEARRFATLHLGSIQDSIGDWSVQPNLFIRLASKFARKISDQDWKTIWLRSSRVQKLVYRLREYKPDVISLHNIHEAGLQPDLLRQLVQISPVTWTLHDMWAFTGGCTHALGCTKYIEGCDKACQCQRSVSKQIGRSVGRNWKLRQKIYEEIDNRMVFITPSRWLAKEGKNGLLSQADIHVIPNGLDIKEYYPLPITQARTALGLPPQVKIVLFSVAWLSNQLKGLFYIVEVLNELAARYPKILFLTIGDGTSKDTFSSLKVKHIHYGRVDNANFMRLCYNVADVCVLPSLAENLPNTLLEALACGIPCVGFDVGGVSEIIRPGETGFIAEPKNIESLSQALRQVLDLGPYARQILSRRCRQVAENEYNLDLYARRHIDLFERLVNTL